MVDDHGDRSFVFRGNEKSLVEKVTTPTSVWITTMLVCEHENVSMWALSMYISRYFTSIEGAYNINTYNIGIYNIVALYSLKVSII